MGCGNAYFWCFAYFWGFCLVVSLVGCGRLWVGCYGCGVLGLWADFLSFGFRVFWVDGFIVLSLASGLGFGGLVWFCLFEFCGFMLV